MRFNLKRHCDIFIPNDLLRQPHGVFSGYIQVVNNHYYVSCKSVKSTECTHFLQDSILVSDFPHEDATPVNVGVLCKLNETYCTCRIDLNPQVCFKICTDSNCNSIKVMELLLNNEVIPPQEHSKIILYDKNKLCLSELFREQYLNRERYLLSKSNEKMDFVEFLWFTANPEVTNAIDCSQKKHLCLSESPSCTKKSQQEHTFSHKDSRSVTAFLISKIQGTVTGKHLWRRTSKIWELFSRDRSSLRDGNIISAFLLDTVLGLIMFWVLLLYTPPVEMLVDSALNHTNVIVNELQSLIHWLMGMPAGLKLNRALNSALGHFFLYHIYLWKTYIVVITPLFFFVLEAFAFAGLLGLTCQLSLLSDLLSLSTIHVYCFYGYAARLYRVATLNRTCRTVGKMFPLFSMLIFWSILYTLIMFLATGLYNFQVSSLCSLWRLFRGKKWNPLRNRVDSYAYGPEQLFMGTLTFTILLFLFPTVFMYYLVFTLLRLVVLMIQGVLRKIIDFISYFPAYVILLHLIGSDKLNGDIQFTVMPKSIGESVKLKLQIVQASKEKVIAQTKDSASLEDTCLTWGQLLHNLIWGLIIYPI